MAVWQTKYRKVCSPTAPPPHPRKISNSVYRAWWLKTASLCHCACLVVCRCTRRSQPESRTWRCGRPSIARLVHPLPPSPPQKNRYVSVSRLVAENSVIVSLCVPGCLQMYEQVTAKIKNMAVRQTKYRKVCSPPPPPSRKISNSVYRAWWLKTVSLCHCACLVVCRCMRRSQPESRTWRCGRPSIARFVHPLPPPPPSKISTSVYRARWLKRQKKPARNMPHSACPSVCSSCIVPRPRGRQCQTSFRLFLPCVCRPV